MMRKLQKEYQLPMSFIRQLARQLDAMAAADRITTFRVVHTVVALLPRELKQQNRREVERITLGINHIVQLCNELQLLSGRFAGPEKDETSACHNKYFEAVFDIANRQPELELNRNTMLQWVHLIDRM